MSDHMNVNVACLHSRGLDYRSDLHHDRHDDAAHEHSGQPVAEHGGDLGQHLLLNCGALRREFAY